MRITNIQVSQRLLWMLFLILALFKLWLVSGQTLSVNATARHDDRLFLNIADALLSGDWLGSYNVLTLAKGPLYSIWIALTFLLGIPLLLAQHLLYILACIIFVTAIKPLILKPSLLLLIYTVLLFNPMSYTTKFMTRVLRGGIYPALTIIVVACAIGLLLKYNQSLKSLTAWSVGLGFALSAFWLTREEGIWIMPLILLVTVFVTVKIWQTHLTNWKIRLLLCFLPFVIWLFCMATVASINKISYGIFATVEFKAHDFTSAYGALQRVKHSEWKPYLPVPREARERIYENSPAFSELKQYLEGDMGTQWSYEGCRLLSICNDIAGGWFVWAFRDAVAATGYYSSGASAMQYYRRLAEEINTACMQGRLDCYTERSSMIPPWHNEYILPILKTFIREISYLVHFKGFNSYPSPSIGTEESLVLFRDLTLQRLSPVLEGSNVLLPHQTRLDNLKLKILSWIGKGYQYVTPLLAGLSVTAYIISIVQGSKAQINTTQWLINTMLLIIIASILFILSMIHVTSFSTITPVYLAPVYPLMLIFTMFNILFMQRLFHQILNRKKISFRTLSE